MTEPTQAEVEIQAPVAADASVPETSHALVTKSLPRAAETRRLYTADWADFVAWCRHHQRRPLPAAPETVTAYLASLSNSLAPGALARRAAAVADRHRRVEHVSPCADGSVRAVLRATRALRQPALRAEGKATAVGKAGRRGTYAAHPSAYRRGGAVLSAAEAAQLTRMAARCPGDLAGLRDRALLLLAAAGIGGDRLLAMDREHVRLADQPLTVHISASDPEAVVVISRGATIANCPVRALDSWIRISDTRFGPIFRKVDRWGNLEHQRLRTDGLRRIWQRRGVSLRPSRSKTTAAA